MKVLNRGWLTAFMCWPVRRTGNDYKDTRTHTHTDLIRVEEIVSPPKFEVMAMVPPGPEVSQSRNYT